MTVERLSNVLDYFGIAVCAVRFVRFSLTRLTAIAVNLHPSVPVLRQ